MDAGVTVFDTARAYSVESNDLVTTNACCARAWRDPNETPAGLRVDHQCVMRATGGTWLPDGRGGGPARQATPMQRAGA